MAKNGYSIILVMVFHYKYKNVLRMLHPTAKSLFVLKMEERSPDMQGKAESYSITGLVRPYGLQVVGASRISRQSAHIGGKFVRPTRRPPLPPRRYPWYLYVLEAESTPGSAVNILSEQSQTPDKGWSSSLALKSHDVM